MTDWDKIGRNAARKASAKSSGPKNATWKSLAAAFPDPKDRIAARKLWQTINAKSSRNERISAIKTVAKGMSATALKTLKGALLAIAVCLLCPGSVRAQERPITAIDLNAPLSDARTGLAWNREGEQLWIAYVPLIYWVGSLGQEYATLNFGVTDKLSNGKAGYLVSIGPRIDTFFRKAANSKFAKKHLRFAILPPLQINFNFVTSDFKVLEPHLSICTRFGGK